MFATEAIKMFRTKGVKTELASHLVPAATAAEEVGGVCVCVGGGLGGGGPPAPYTLLALPAILGV